MQVGSKVVMIKPPHPLYIQWQISQGSKIEQIPEKEKVYTVREMWKCKEDNCGLDHILLEEIRLGTFWDGTEMYFDAEDWREVQPPQQNVDELINGALRESIKQEDEYLLEV